MDRWLMTCSAVATLGLIALGGAGFGVWLIGVLDGASAIDALLVALFGFGLWSLIAAGFGLAILRLWRRGGNN